MDHPTLPDMFVQLSQDPAQNNDLEAAVRILGPEAKWSQVAGPTAEGHLGNRMRRWSLWLLAQRFTYALGQEVESRKALPWNKKKEGPWEIRKTIYGKVHEHALGLAEALETLGQYPGELELLHQGQPFGIGDLQKRLRWIAESASADAKAQGSRKRDVLTESAGNPGERLVWDLRMAWEQTGKPAPDWSGEFRHLVESVARVAGRNESLARPAIAVLPLPSHGPGPMPLSMDAAKRIAGSGWPEWRQPPATGGNRC
jgi:hypothetical protein